MVRIAGVRIIHWLGRLEITRARFPDAADQGSNALAILREVLPSGARTVSLDYLITALGFAQAAARQEPGGLKHTPPDIIWATNRTVLVMIDGEPILRLIPGAVLERVVNTPALLVHGRANAKFYLAGDNRWFASGSVKGPWPGMEVYARQVAALPPDALELEGSEAGFVGQHSTRIHLRRP